MPFTVSHIAAVLPLNKRLAKYTALSPLVIGSMTPDVGYWTPFLVNQRMETHSLIGLYLFCIPMGLTIYFLYHLLMAPVIVSFLPRNIQRHLNPNLFIGKLPPTPAHVLLISLILGAITHIVWDFFTHQSGIPQYITWFEIPLMTIDGYDVKSYRVLQHLSSILGLGLLAYWILRWYKRKRLIKNYANYWQAPKELKTIAIALIGLVTLLGAAFNAFMYQPETDVLYGIYSAQIYLRHAVVGAMGSFMLACLGAGVLYQVRIKAKK